MKLLFTLLLLVFNAHLLLAQKHFINDSSQVDVRSFNAERLKELQSKTEFQYDRFREPPRSLWDRFWSWLWQKVEDVLRTRRGRLTVWTILVLFGAAVIIFFIVKVMGMRDGGLFGRKSVDVFPYTTSADDINQINFEGAIREAIDDKNYRLAVRLLYLQSLKNLSDKGYIEWQINKTNTDYIYEVSSRPWQSLFRKLTQNFEYIWYGEMPLDNEYFANLHVQYQQFNNQL
jgi:hypothetical protein